MHGGWGLHGEGGACMAGGVCGRGHPWQGACMVVGMCEGMCVVGDMHGGGHEWWGACGKVMFSQVSVCPQGVYAPWTDPPARKNSKI